MSKPNLPESPIKTAIVSSQISAKMEYSLNNYCISTLKVYGKMNCDDAVKQHTDLYIMHLINNKIFYAKNICSIVGDFNNKFIGLNIDSCKNKVSYPEDVLFNAVSLGDDIICCQKYVHQEILDAARMLGFNIINVNQGYTKCNICVVDEKSIITEDVGIAKTLRSYDYDVLLLNRKCVSLCGYDYGFIGGASGKISVDKLAFFGDITKHSEYEDIYKFLIKRNIEPISLSNEPLTDLGSLIPVF